MTIFKKQNNDHVFIIEKEEITVDPEKIAEGQFLAIITYVDEEDKFLEAEIFYHPEEKEVDTFLRSIKVGNCHKQKYKLSEELFLSES